MGVYMYCIGNDSTDEQEDFHTLEADAGCALEPGVDLEVDNPRVIVEESDTDSDCSYNINHQLIKNQFSMEEEL